MYFGIIPRVIGAAAFIIILVVISCLVADQLYSIYAQEMPDGQNPEITITNDSGDDEDRTPLMIEHIVTSNTNDKFLGPNFAFLGQDDILSLDSSGKVWRIINGHILEEPLIDLDVYRPDGLVGIAIAKGRNDTTYVFLYLNEAPSGYAADINTEQDGTEEASTLNQTLGYVREGDRLYRYELIANKLVNGKLLFSIPDKTPNLLTEIHHGGEVIIGPDDTLYVVVGEIDGGRNVDSRTKAQNYDNGTSPDGRAGILGITQDGEVVNNTGILGDEHPLDMYYAYGIRNSFGMDFDPVTGNLWDTENGPAFGDEINLVEPGFNSGWYKGSGLWNADGETKGEGELDSDNLVDFNGKGKYSDPEFTWNLTVAPTALKFLDSDKYGKEYENDMFVADINQGNLYHFELNENRTELSLDGVLQDRVADKPSELEQVIFAKGFNGIADLQVGPDGYLYILSHGSIFRIVPKVNN